MEAYALETESKSLTFSDDKRQKRFELGVCMAIYNWEDLATAVENNWGGSDSADIRDWMVGTIVDLFEDNYTDSGEIETRLLQIMQDEFEVNIEDGSGEAVAQQVVKVYRECAEENFATVDELYKRYQDREEKRRQGLLKPVVVRPTSEGGDDEDDDEDDEEDNDEDANDWEDVPKTKSQGPIIDEDGFELVQKKNHR